MGQRNGRKLLLLLYNYYKPPLMLHMLVIPQLFTYPHIQAHIQV